MNRISSDTDLIQTSYDIVVIGSGYGGGICSSRLSRAGKKVCLLERGKEILPGDFPDTQLEAAEQLQIDTCKGKVGSSTGLYNIHVNKEQNIVVGCGLGGTSLINANVSLEPRSDVFEDPRWPDEIRAHKDSLLKDGFDRAREMLKPNPYPTSHPTLAKLTANKKSAYEMGQAENFYCPPINVTFQEPEGGVNHVGVKQNACVNCGDCVSGCNYAAKNTTQMNYLPDAHNHGAEIFCEMLVSHVEKVDDGWLVHYQPQGKGREKFNAPTQFVKAQIVIVSAGTLGSTEILLRSKEKGLQFSDQLGKNFSGNGDILGFGYNTDQVINGIGFGQLPVGEVKDVGPCITSIIDMRLGNNRQERMVIEEGSLPGAIGNLVPAAMAATSAAVGKETDDGFVDTVKEKVREWDSLIKGPYSGAINNTQTYLIMSHDDGAGVMTLEDNKLRVNWPGVGEQANFFNGNENLYAATKALGGEYVENPIWTDLFNKSIITVHPLGGCVIGADAIQGVTNHKGQVFSSKTGTDVYQDLYVADGSVIPTSLAVNPLLTICAMSERCCTLIAEDRGWSINYSLPSKSKQAPQSKKLGIEFTETMTGYFSKNAEVGESIKSYQNAADTGQASASTMKFTLTVSSNDLNTMIESPEHAGKIVGTLEAPELSSYPLMVNNGVFNLFVVYPDTPDTRHMNYKMQLTGENGESYYFVGYKIVKDSCVTTMWHDTSTLYVTIYNGNNDQGAIVGKGLLHIELADFARQMTTMQVTNAKNTQEKLKGLAMFGKYFAGALWQTYGGALYEEPRFNPNAPARKKRPLRAGVPEVHRFDTQDNVNLKLTRHRGGSKGPVMLVHGLGVASSIFSTDTIQTNLLEYLFAHQYDVWLLDIRVSIDLPVSKDQSNGDQVAKYDFPAAINVIKQKTGCQSIQALVHCYGATTFFMSMLSGLQDVRSIVCSQIATNLVIPKSTEIKTGVHLPGFLEKIGIGSMTAYTDTNESLLDKVFDKAVEINALSQVQGRCDNPVCHRITFLYSSLYRHETLNNRLHENLHELFGEANITTLKHLAEMCRQQKLVTADGDNIYMNNLENLNLPICFISGEKNECYFPESTEITYNMLKEKFGSENYSRKVIPNYGHIDCIFGKDAVDHVYPTMLAHLEKTAIT